ncbi:MAG: hypothetical protein IPK62_10325 [Bacteroidetes bacterium]|nr:hypothetical protein [Bacteroidota bacterium]MBK8145348.1 hypothetical protein [Bacteroidota bacterium]MBP6315023.1 hypothetical protein [Chitinophagaceae bacterium]
MNSDLDLLSQISSVEAPPFLLDKISQKIEGRKKRMVSPKLAYTLTVAFTVVLAINIVFIFRYSTSKPNHSDWIGSMSLLEDHSLYK